jgi:hypothetical protein
VLSEGQNLQDGAIVVNYDLPWAIIRSRTRVRQRLQENAEVVGTDEAFFEDDQDDQAIRDLFTEKAGILDGDAATEVDLGSYAFQIWKNALDRDPSLQKAIPALPDVVYSTKPHASAADQPEGVLVYVRTAQANDALAWVDTHGNPHYRVPVCHSKSRRVRA